jgi:hypothetical protein
MKRRKQSDAKRGFYDYLERPSFVSWFKPKLRIVSNIPKIFLVVQDLTEIRRGFAGSPNFFLDFSSNFYRHASMSVKISEI